MEEPIQLACARQVEELHRDRMARLADLQGLIGEVVRSGLELAHQPGEPVKEENSALILQLLAGLADLYVAVAQENPGEQQTLQQLAETVICQSAALAELQQQIRTS